MRVTHLPLAILLAMLVNSPVRAELRHVELKTLGMD